MVDGSIPRSAASAHLLVNFGHEHGVSRDVCLRGTGIEPGLVASGAGEVWSWQELRLVRNLLASLPPQPHWGLRAGARYHLSANGLAGLALISAADFGTGMDFSMRYRSLFTAFCRVSAESSGGQMYLTLDDSRLPADVRAFLLWRDLRSLVNAVTDAGLPAQCVLRVEIAGPVVEQPEIARRLLRTHMRFDMPVSRLVLDAALLGAGLPQANAATFRYCEQECALLLRRRRERSGVAGMVRTLLLEHPSNTPTVGQVAAEMLTTVRTLRRRLAQSGTSFRELVVQTKSQLAQQMLASTRLPVQEIALRLGYSEAAAFNHAFTAWTGQTPGAFRLAQRQASP